MKDASHFVRKSVYDALNGNVTLDSANVPVYNVVPSSATSPYILITSLQNNIVQNIKDTFLMQVQTQIDVVTSFDTNTGGQLNANLIMNQITNLLVSRNSFFDLSSNNFKCVSSQNDGIAYVTDDTATETIFRAILTLTNDVEQL
tara:strand:+ start:860 stop:1294 length:435 start_codon:yes stop_codon:yes gene_type:complete